MIPLTGVIRVPEAGRRPAGSRRRAGDSRSVMPLEAAGCTRATVRAGESAERRERSGARGMPGWKRGPNEEFSVSAGHQPAETASLSLVHTARRYLRWACAASACAREPARLDWIKVVTRFP